MGLFCLPCQSYLLAEQLGKPNKLFFLLSCIGLPCIPAFIMRGDMRDLNNIRGSTSEDALVACCLPCCAQIQVANELQEMQDKEILEDDLNGVSPISESIF